MIKTKKILMRITRRSDEDATTKRNPLRAMHLKKVKALKTGLFTFFLGIIIAFSTSVHPVIRTHKIDIIKYA